MRVFKNGITLSRERQGILPPTGEDISQESCIEGPVAHNDKKKITYPQGGRASLAPPWTN